MQRSLAAVAILLLLGSGVANAQTNSVINSDPAVRATTPNASGGTSELVGCTTSTVTESITKQGESALPETTQIQLQQPTRQLSLTLYPNKVPSAGLFHERSE